MVDHEILRAATEIKLQELERHEAKLSHHYETLLASLQQEQSPCERLRVLHAGVQGLHVLGEHVHHDSLEGVDDLLTLGDVDPISLGPTLQRRVDGLQADIAQRRSLWQHNKLLGRLLLQELSDQREKQQQQQAHEIETTTKSTEKPEEEDWDLSVASASSLSMETQRLDAQRQLEACFFSPSGVCKQDITAFLQDHVFQRSERYTEKQWRNVLDTLETVRSSMKHFAEAFDATKVTPEEIAALAHRMLQDKGSLSSAMIRLLETAERDAAMREELAHVVTIKISMLSEFAWPASGVPVVVKCAVNGRYRSLLQEDAVTFLVFQYVGYRWAAAIKRELMQLLRVVDLDRMGHVASESLHGRRLRMRQRCMLLALPDSLETDAMVDGYDGGAGDSGGAHVWRGHSQEPTVEKRVSKQDLLRLLCTEAHLSAMVSEHSKFTAVSTDIEFFGPSVSHEAVLAVLEFLGVPPAMCAVFETHMKMPIRFPGADRPEVIMKGVVAARMLSRFYSELLLFVMDIAVMMRSGVFLYRVHDDICFFAEDTTAVRAAWREVHAVVDAFKLKLNETKSGAVVMGAQAAESSVHDDPQSLPLPTTPIRWGMLELQADASVRIVESQVDWFAHELARKLDATTSVLRWTTVYNKYMAFFLRNFGDASEVFGATHVHEMLQAVRRIHVIAFSCNDGDVLAALRAKVAAAVPNETAPLPAAWVFWPLEHGGLGLFNPLLRLWSLQVTLQTRRSDDGQWRVPFGLCREQLKKQHDAFVELVQEQGLRGATRATYGDYDLANALDMITSKKRSDSYMATCGRMNAVNEATFEVRSLSQFLRRVQRSDRYTMLWHEYETLLERVNATAAATNGMYFPALTGDPYWSWVAQVYRDELMSMFGTLEFFNRELLPTQLIDEIKRTGIYWS
ncbi:hypothetical protein PINS_up020730 [Pythium insidiosum]|nr:hypothetical protein PINS_up020730 [Pythium insidiosum]